MIRKHNQLSTTQLAAQVAAIEADRQARPLHPNRLKVEGEIWPKYREAHEQARGQARKDLAAAFDAEVNGFLFPNKLTHTERAEIRAALNEVKARMLESRMERFQDSHFSISWFLDSTNLVDLALAQAHHFAAVALARQIAAHL